jgi:branched chain amino acid aminotransferase apoenzyme (EC 2.6.1.42)
MDPVSLKELDAIRTGKDLPFFRLEDHVRRLFDSAKIYMIDIPYTEEEICEAVIETVKINNLKECYIRPVVFRGHKELGRKPP